MSNCFFPSCGEADRFAIETKTFGLFRSDKHDPNFNIHIHECCEILYCVSGGQSFLIDDRVYEVKDGDLFIINQFEAHKITPMAEKPFSRTIMHIHPTFLYAHSDGDTDLSYCFYCPGRENRLSLNAGEQSVLYGLFSELDREYGYGDSIYKTHRAVEILLAVNRMFATHNEKEVPFQPHKTVQLAIDCINNNYSQMLTLETVAKSAYVSVNQLCRLFKTYCGTTVTQYLTSKRIGEAKRLLEEGHSVTETAFMCGFNDYANFIRVFKKKVGVPPGRYKTSLGGKE